MSFKFNFFDLDESSNPGEDHKNDKNKSQVEFDPIQNIITITAPETKKYKKHKITPRENTKLGNIKSTNTNPTVKYRVNTKVKVQKGNITRCGYSTRCTYLRSVMLLFLNLTVR